MLGAQQSVESKISHAAAQVGFFAQASIPPKNSKKRILIVDDQFPNLNISPRI